MYEMIKLPYQFTDFPDTLSPENLRLHYDILYKGYVDKYNKAMLDLDEARNTNNYDRIKCLEKELVFQGAGAILHTLFFENITPRKTNISPRLLNHITKDFNSLNTFMEQFIKSSISIEGSGWNLLGYNKKLNKLFIIQAEKHQNLTLWDFTPILALDMWEHAYYLDYGTNKQRYVENVLSIINWDIVDNRLDKAIKDSMI